MRNKKKVSSTKASDKLTSKKIRRQQSAVFILLFVLIRVLAGWSSNNYQISPNQTNLSSIFADDLQVIHCGFPCHPVSLANFRLFDTRLEKPQTEPLFGEDPDVISIVWSVVWRIPWRAQFGKLFEWTPFFISFGWLIVWHLIMLIIHYIRTLKQQNVNSMFYEFTKFVQIIYGFCCTQALL